MKKNIQTYRLDRNNKGTNRGLVHAVALVDGIYNLHVFQEGSRNEPALEQALDGSIEISENEATMWSCVSPLALLKSHHHMLSAIGMAWSCSTDPLHPREGIEQSVNDLHLY